MLEHWPKVINLEKSQAVQLLVTESLGIQWPQHVQAAPGCVWDPDREAGLSEAALHCGAHGWPRSGWEAASEESKEEERQVSRPEGGRGGRASGREEEST